MTTPRPEPDAHRRAEALVTAWKQRIFPGAQIEPPDRWLMEAVAAALAAAVEECATIAEEMEPPEVNAIEMQSSRLCYLHGERIAAAIRARGAGGAV